MENGEDSTKILRSWVDQHAERMYSWAYHKTSDHGIAEDLVQDTFLEAVRSFDKFKGDSKPRTWLFAILNHKIIDHHRRQFRNPTVNESNLQSPGTDNDNDFLETFFDSNERWRPDQRPQNWDTDGELLDDPEFRNVMDYCMSELPEQWFSAVRLNYLEEKDGNAICQDLGITSSNFWQILHRARLKLRKCLDYYWFKKK